MKLRVDPVPVFWRKASCWRKLRLLRYFGNMETFIAQKYLKEMNNLRREDGGFSRTSDEQSSVTVTAEAIMNLICSGVSPNSPSVQKALNFLLSLQKENGSWRENPKLSKDRIPFWSSCEKGVPILTADCIEAFVEAGYRNDERIIKAVEWLKQMQSPDGMWLSLEDTDPNDTEPDSTQRAISALIKFGLPKDSHIIKNACVALEKFILREAAEWAKTHPPVWPWIASLDGLVAAGYTVENKAVNYALKNIVEQQQEDGSWPNNYELRVVPTLIKLDIIQKEQASETIKVVDSEQA
jgi:squalene cyclase